MCGRFTQHQTPGELQQFFELLQSDGFAPRYNIAPTQSVPVIRVLEGQRVATNLRWGLIPLWACSAAEGSGQINCRSESAATKPAFRRAFRERRCLVPATGFYEWQAAGKSKQPWYLTLKSGHPAAFAGLWETWHDAEQRVIESFTILTMPADAFMGEVHHRMPITLDRSVWPQWLNPGLHDAGAIQSLLVPSREPWQRVPVSRLVNNIRNDSPECVRVVRADRGLFDP